MSANNKLKDNFNVCSQGDTLKRIRLALGLTIDEISGREKSGLSKCMLSAFELGNRKLSKDSATKILDFLQLTKEEYLSISDYLNKKNNQNSEEQSTILELIKLQDKARETLSIPPRLANK